MAWFACYNLVCVLHPNFCQLFFDMIYGFCKHSRAPLKDLPFQIVPYDSDGLFYFVFNFHALVTTNEISSVVSCSYS